MLKAKVLGVAVTLAVAQWAYAEVAVPGEEYLGDPESDASERQRATPRDDARARGSIPPRPRGPSAARDDAPARGSITTTPPRKFRLPPPTADERDDEEEAADGLPTPTVYRVGFGRSFEDHGVAVPDQAALRWRSTAGGGQVATFDVVSPGAAALRAQLVFQAAPAGTEVRVYDPDAPATTTEVVTLTAEWREELATDGSATFQTLPYDRPSSDLEHVKFILADVDSDAAAVYYMNSNTWRSHLPFVQSAFGWQWRDLYRAEHIRGEIVYHPYLMAPNGEAGTFRFIHIPWESRSFEQVARSFELIAASMPFLRNNLVYHPRSGDLARYEREKVRYDASRVPVYLYRDLAEGLVFHSMNAAVGYGFLRVLGGGERPTFRDVAILHRLPNELSAVAGVITLEPRVTASTATTLTVAWGAPLDRSRARA